MRKKLSGAHICAVLVLCGVSSLFAAARCRVEVKNNTVITDQGTLIRGADFLLHLADDFKTQAALTRGLYDSVAARGFNCVRISCVFDNRYPPWYTTEEMLPMLDTIANYTEDVGLYMIVDYHDCGGYNKTHMMDFWTKVAPRFKDRTHIFYELMNEPVQWAITNYTNQNLRDQEAGYTLIRGLAPETHIVLISVAQAQANIANVVNNLQGIDWSNASVAFHLYGTSTSMYAIDLHNKYPAFCTEFSLPGSSDYECCMSPIDGESWMVRWLEREGISWVLWISGVTLEKLANLDQQIDNANSRGYMWDIDDFEAIGCGPQVTPPSITAQPEDATVDEGSDAVFTVEAQGDNLSYQWQKDGEDIEGATSAQLEITNVNIDDEGDYRCVITNDEGEVTSDVVALTVKMVGVTFYHKFSKGVVAGIEMDNNGSVHAFLPREAQFSLNLVGVNGKMVSTYSGYGSGYSVQSKSLTPGVYIFSLNSTGWKVSKKVVIPAGK